MLKGTLVVLYVILFGSQLSDKFYLYANFTSRRIKGCHCKIAHTRPFIHSGSSLLDHQRVSSLSLDKRYEFKAIFALLSPEFTLNTVFVDGKNEFSTFYQVFLPSHFALHPLRGPPSV